MTCGKRAEKDVSFDRGTTKTKDESVTSSGSSAECQVEMQMPPPDFSFLTSHPSFVICGTAKLYISRCTRKDEETGGGIRCGGGMSADVDPVPVGTMTT